MSARREFRIKGGARCRREGLAFIGGLESRRGSLKGDSEGGDIEGFSYVNVGGSA